jgi:hypothetical protein
MLGEAALVMVVLGSVIAIQMALSKSFYLFRRYFWLDEIVTHKLISDRNTAHAFSALVGGLDTNPPSYHLLLCIFRMVVRDAGEVALRCFALFSVLAALTGLYVSLRQAYPPPVAFTAVLAVWTHPLILWYAFEARMYGPWLAAVVWFSYFLARSWTSSIDCSLMILLACTSYLVCTMHTMGIVAFGLVLSFHLLFHQFSTWSWSALLIASLGPLATLAWSPFLSKQNQVCPVTGAYPPNRHIIFKVLQTVLVPRPLAVVLLAGGLSPYLPRVCAQIDVFPTTPGDPRALAGLVGLVFMPLIPTVLSLTLEPLLMHPRYALPTVASFAPAVATIIACIPDIWLIPTIIIIIVFGVDGLSDLRVTYRNEDRQINELIHAIRHRTGQSPVLFEKANPLYVVCRYAPDLAGRCFGLDFHLDQLGHVEDHPIRDRDILRVFARFYPPPTLMSWEAARSLPKQYIVPSVETLRQDFTDSGHRYCGFTARLIEGGLYELIPVNQQLST